MDQDRLSNFTLNQQELEHQFETTVLPLYMERLTAVNYPLLIMLAGQPGSGKTTASKKLAIRHGLDPNKVLRVDIDTFRRHHPSFGSICEANLLEMEKYTGAFSFECRKRIYDLARIHKAPIIIENSIANVEANILLMREFAASGYQVELHTMAVHSKDSSFGIFSRFIDKESRRQYTGRWVNLSSHNEAYSKLPGNFERILASGIPTRCGIYTRTEEVLTANIQDGVPERMGDIIRQYRIETEKQTSVQTRLVDWQKLQKLAENSPHMPEKVLQYMEPYILEAELALSAVPYISEDDMQSGCVKAVTPHFIFVDLPRGTVAYDKLPDIQPNVYPGEHWYPKLPNIGYPQRRLGRAPNGLKL